LALGPDGWLQVVNFIVFGVLLLGFARAVNAVPVRDRWDRAAQILVGLAGIAAVALAFKDDPEGETTWHGAVHAAAYLTWLASIVVSYPLSGGGFARTPSGGRRHGGRVRWRSSFWCPPSCSRTAVQL
jgi:hypothetical protein